MRNGKFIQIVAASDGNEMRLYALDAEGAVWEYTPGTVSSEDAWSKLTERRKGGR